ncbi:ABC transporter permease [Cytobacillus firmus]|uniref:ABC transporter permease n=1 Tax=Cytobacillus firmus TaxID=1399 RepID=UPI0009EDA916|nr:ABC transporter permease [Cytobacillus firmus]MDD9310568.1 ABC transporter permease [Cytobacillus firmus]MEC1895447.1 ABC transporter permease [Cytobacillus firmus]MED1907625.1 ABC transporter permease [Cytobacillus firmus]MED1939659.1 ABC transporter permease [Cytobacillus firmus]MED4450970.1 ABC transporter permease [Cytobacillus firmus]
MNSRSLFAERLIRSWKYQAGIFRSIADWTIMVYLIVPGTVIFGMIYRSWWLEIPEWIAGLPLFLLFFLLYIFSWMGNLRPFVLEADKVFLVKNKTLFMGMRKWGFVYSLFFQAIGTAAMIAIFLPFLKNRYFLEWSQIVTLLLFFISLKWSIMIVSYFLKRIEGKLKRYVITFVLFVLMSWFSQLVYSLWSIGADCPVIIASAVLLSGALIRASQLLKKISALEFEVMLEQEEKTKYIKWIFMMAPDLEKPVVSMRTKPLLFRNSRRIFNTRTAITGLAELFLKIFMRNPSYIFSYFQIISVSAAGILLIPPLWIKVIVSGVFLFLMYSWLSLTWDKAIMSHPFTKKYSEKDYYFTARNRTVLALFLLAIFLLGLFLSASTLILARFSFPGA